MKLFLDSGDINEIREAYKWGGLDGVTSNPKLITENWKGGVWDFLRELTGLGIADPVIITISSHNQSEMLDEAKAVLDLYPNVIIKLYMTKEHLAFIQELKKIGIKAHISLIYSVNQAFLAAKAGADVISPFVGRVDDFGGDGSALLIKIIEMVRQYRFETEVMAASLRNPYHVTQAILAGSDIITIPFDVLEKMFMHPATDVGIQNFSKVSTGKS